MWLKAASSRHSQVRLAELIPGSVYSFRIKAENPYGVSEPSHQSDPVQLPAATRCDELLAGLIIPHVNTSELMISAADESAVDQVGLDLMMDDTTISSSNLGPPDSMMTMPPGNDDYNEDYDD